MNWTPWARTWVPAATSTRLPFLSTRSKAYLDQALDLYADVILNPSFPEADFKRLQKQRLAGIQREKVEPNSMALAGHAPAPLRPGPRLWQSLHR